MAIHIKNQFGPTIDNNGVYISTDAKNAAELYDRLAERYGKNFEDANFEEVSEEQAQEIQNICANNKTYPPSVTNVFTDIATLEPYLRKMVSVYYKKSPVMMSYIYCVLRDYSQLVTIGDYAAFVNALIELEILPKLEDKEKVNLQNGISGNFRMRMDHGQRKDPLEPDFRHWTDNARRQNCENIASVFGEEDGAKYPEGHFKYNYPL